MSLYDWRGFGKNEVEGTEKVETGQAEYLAVDEACESYDLPPAQKAEYLTNLYS